MTRDDMLERMTPLEFEEWKAFYFWEQKQLKPRRNRSMQQTPEEILEALGG